MSVFQRNRTELAKSRPSVLDKFETSLINSELIKQELETDCKNMRYSSLTPNFRTLGLSSNNAAATLTSIYKGTDLAWENALSEVLAVLKIQYRSDVAVASFLASEENIRQLKYSHVARMEYNRRCIHEDVTATAIHSAPRARRIAKEVAIDYIRKYLDGDYERYEVSPKMFDDFSLVPVEKEILELNSSGGSITKDVCVMPSGRLSRRLSIKAETGAEVARMPVVRTRSGMMVEAAPVSKINSLI